ncbi:MAG: nitroreductase family protein [Planctomycetota bacterium]|jgi:nitroreductase
MEEKEAKLSGENIMVTEQNRRSFLKLGATVGTGLALGGMSITANGQTQKNDLTIFDVFEKRRSVRKFKSIPVPEEHIKKILDAAHLAPTGGNKQPWKFLVIRDRGKLNELKEKSISQTLERHKKQKDFNPNTLDAQQKKYQTYYENYLSAPVYVVVLVDNSKGTKITQRYNMKDGALAAGYLMLAARALGYGTVFCTDSISEELTQKIFNIPEHYTRICITPVGIPEDWPESPSKKSLDELVVYEKFQ